MRGQSESETESSEADGEETTSWLTRSLSAVQPTAARQVMIVDLVNPRLEKFQHALAIAVAVMIGQSCLVVLGALFFHYYGSIITSEQLMSQQQANDPESWEEADIDHSYVIYSGSVLDIYRYASPQWHGYNQSVVQMIYAHMDLTFERKPWWDQMYHNFEEVPAWWVPWDTPSILTSEMNASLQNANPGEFQIPCHILNVTCTEYVDDREKNTICDDEFFCGTSTGFVAITEAVPSTWPTCFSNAMAYVGYCEIAVTAFILSCMMCCKKGPCWFTDRANFNEFQAIIAEGQGASDMQAVHSSVESNLALVGLE